MKLKLIIIIILTFELLSCTSSIEKNSDNNDPTNGSLVHTESSIIEKNDISGSSEYKEFYECGFDKFVNDPKTPKLAKDIFLDKEWTLNNDSEVLALLDSLTAKVKNSRPFYFKVVTKSEKKSDGYYSEGLGSKGYNFVLNHTQEFASYFENKKCHTDKDLMTWVDIVSLEINLNSEGDDYKTIVEEFLKNLKTNCKNCTGLQKETINKFRSLLKEEWDKF